MVRGRLCQRLPQPRTALGNLGRDLFRIVAAPKLIVIDEGLVQDEIHDPAEVLPVPDRDLHGVRIGLQPVAHHLDDPTVVGPDPVHLVHECDAGDPVAVRLAPDSLGLRFHASHGAEDSHSAVEHAERTLDFDCEIDMPRGVDDVDPVFRPRARPVRRGGSRRNRDAAFLLLLHPVHRRRSVMDLPHAVQAPRVEQDALGRGRLPRVDVRHDSDIAESLERVSPRHRFYSLPPFGSACCGRRHRVAPAGFWFRPLSIQTRRSDEVARARELPIVTTHHRPPALRAAPGEPGGLSTPTLCASSGQTVWTTSDSGRTPCSLPPFGACLPSS